MYPYESIPPVDESLFKGEFQWLSLDDEDEDDDDDDWDDDGDADDDEAADEDDDEDDEPPAGPSQTERLKTLTELLATVDLKLPAAFLTFMGDYELKSAVPSCTGCDWDLSERLIESPFEDDSFLIRFLRDSQDVLFWYLHLTPTGHCVLCSPIPFDDPTLDEPPDVLLAETVWVAPHFEHFVYRFWIENVLWELLEDGASLTPVEAAYVGHYKKKKKTRK